MSTNEYESLASGYLQSLLEANRHEAMQCILEEVESGLPLEDVYLRVLQPVMYEVGRMWQVGEIDIAVEHYCTAATQLLMARLFPYTLSSNPRGVKMVGCCLGSELHELGLRMVCDLFELEGWDTYFMGAITPGKSVLLQIEEQVPDLLCLSSTMQYGVPQIRDLIAEIRSNPVLSRVKIMVGGLAFILSPDLFQQVGADATAINAKDGVRTAAQLVENRC